MFIKIIGIVIITISAMLLDIHSAKKRWYVKILNFILMLGLTILFIEGMESIESA